LIDAPLKFHGDGVIDTDDIRNGNKERGNNSNEIHYSVRICYAYRPYRL